MTANSEDDEDSLTAKDLSDLLYEQISKAKAFDAIASLSRRTPTRFVVFPFAGPALRVTVTVTMVRDKREAN